MKKYIYILLLILAAPLGLRAQTGGGNWAGVVFKSSSGGAVPASGATITVCSTATVLVNGVCPAQENDVNCCFTDASLTVHLNGGAPFTADARGNVSFWGIAGTYQLTVSGTGISAYTTNVQVACTPGAIGCGLQTSTVNTFTAQQNFDANVANKGPNPWADVTRFGGYFGSQTPPSTTGAITTGTPALVLANAQDFANGQGVLVLGAGPATSLSTPTGVVAAPWGVTGSTTYKYCVVAEDYLFGRTACSAAGASTTSAATLGVNTATLSSCNRAGGIVTCTTTGNHNFTAGAQVNIVKNSTGDTRFEGAFSIFATPTGSTFTFTQYGAPDVSGTVTSGSAQVNATNIVKWNSDVAGTVLKWHVYRCSVTCTLPANAANYALVGTVVGVDGYFQDYNLALAVANNGNGDVPATAPISATNTALSTTILSGGGTTSLTLANNASATVAGAKVLHDNTPNLVAACTSFTRGGIVYIPTSNVATNWFPINSPFKFSSCTAGGIQLQINNKVFANAPIIMSAYDNIQGLPGGRDSSVASPSFYDLRPHALITGFAYPFIYIPATVVNSSIDDIDFVCNQTYMPCIYHDQLTTGGSATSLRFRHVHANSGSGSNTPWVVKGGFGIFWEYGGWANAASSFAAPPGILFSPNCGLGNTNQQQAYLVTTQYTYGFNGTVFDSCSQSSLQGLNNFSFRDMLGESGLVPMFRFANTGGVGTFNGNPSWWELVRTNYADSLGGIATPVIDATMVNQITGLHVVSPGAPQGPVIETNSGGVTGLDVSADFAGIVGAQFYGIPGSGIFANIPAKASGTLGHFAYTMALPSPPQSAVVSAGGAVPVGAHTYTMSAVDFSGNETTLSTGVTATTTGGNQTVTVTLPAAFPSGAKGVNVYRDGFRANNGSCGTNPQFTTPGGTFADTSNVTCGFSPASANNAGATLVDTNGLTTPKLVVTASSTVDLSRATIFSAPNAAGFVSSATAQFGYDTTLTNWKGWTGIDSIFATFAASASPVSGDVAVLINAGGAISLGSSTPVGLGTAFLKCDGVPSANNGDIFRINNSGHCATATPGIPGRVVTNSGTLSGADLVVCTSGTGDRGSTIIFTNASAVIETLPNPASGACGNNFNVRLFWQGAAGGTLKATTATVNGVAGATGIVIPGNTWVDAISHDNVNYDVYISRGIKCGTNLVEVLNADGTVTCNMATSGNGIISGLTTGVIPKAGSATTIVNGLCDEGNTTANTLTCTHSAGAAFTGSSVKIGASPPALTGNGIGGVETTGQTGVAGSDMFAWNSTDHCAHGIYNNVDLGCVASSPRTACTNGELALSAGWGNTAAATAVAGIGYACKWTITSSGTGQAANPTITDTFVAANVLPIGTMLCDMRMTGGTGTTTLLDETTVSATAPVFTFGGTPVAASTYIVSRRCGP